MKRLQEIRSRPVISNGFLHSNVGPDYFLHQASQTYMYQQNKARKKRKAPQTQKMKTPTFTNIHKNNFILSSLQSTPYFAYFAYT